MWTYEAILNKIICGESIPKASISTGKNQNVCIMCLLILQGLRDASQLCKALMLYKATPIYERKKQNVSMCVQSSFKPLKAPRSSQNPQGFVQHTYAFSCFQGILGKSSCPVAGMLHFNIIDRDRNCFTRQTREAIHIRKVHPPVNRNIGKGVPKVFIEILGNKCSSITSLSHTS